MAWDSGVLHTQSLLRSVVREDPDQVILAASCLELEEIDRLELLMTLAKQWKEQPGVSGLVDSGLTPLDTRNTSAVTVQGKDTSGSSSQGIQSSPPAKQPLPRSTSGLGTLEPPLNHLQLKAILLVSRLLWPLR